MQLSALSDHLSDQVRSFRMFIAADIPLNIQKTIQRQVDNLRNMIGNSSVRWVPAQNIHITLKFLGTVSPSDVDTLSQIIRKEASSHSPFEISISGLGSFPNPKQARVLFIGIQSPVELEALQLGIETACVRIGYDSELRPYSPHLTIGRVRRGIPTTDQQKIHEILKKVKIDLLGTTRVDSVHIYRSEQKPGGAVYTKLFSAPLQK